MSKPFFLPGIQGKQEAHIEENKQNLHQAIGRLSNKESVTGKQPISSSEKRILKEISDSNAAIQSSRLEKARSVYIKIIKRYVKLTAEEQKRVYPSIIMLYRRRKKAEKLFKPAENSFKGSEKTAIPQVAHIKLDLRFFKSKLFLIILSLIVLNALMFAILYFTDYIKFDIKKIITPNSVLFMCLAPIFFTLVIFGLLVGFSKEWRKNFVHSLKHPISTNLFHVGAIYLVLFIFGVFLLLLNIYGLGLDKLNLFGASFSDAGKGFGQTEIMILIIGLILCVVFVIVFQSRMITKSEPKPKFYEEENEEEDPYIKSGLEEAEFSELPGEHTGLSEEKKSEGEKIRQRAIKDLPTLERSFGKKDKNIALRPLHEDAEKFKERINQFRQELSQKKLLHIDFETILHKITQLRVLLDEVELDKAALMYEEVREDYKRLKPEEQQSIAPIILELFNELRYAHSLFN